MLGLGNRIGKTTLVAPGIVTSNLKMLHRYNTGAVVPVSDGAVYTDGSGHINMGDNGDRGTGDVSVGCWFYPVTDTVQGAGLVAKQTNYNANSLGFGLYYRHTATKIYFNIGDTSAGSRTDKDITAIGLSEYQWIHAVGTYDQSTGVNLLYINGIAQDSATQSGLGTLDNSLNLKIGHAGEYFKGYIANAFLSSSVLTQARIKSIMWKSYAGLTTDDTSGLVSWWDLSTNAEDPHGGIDGTLSGTV